MKRLLLMAAAITLTLAACNKKDKNQTPNPPPNNNYYFTAKVDGVDWSADMNSAYTYAQIPHSGFLTLQGTLSTVTDGFFLANLSNYSGPGTYTLGGAGNDNYMRYTTGSVGNGTYSAWKAESPGSTTTGTLTVTAEDANVIEGTFQFNGYSEETQTTKVITDGKFRMPKL